MYISLKWKAVVFLSLVLIAITASWTWQLIDKQLTAFNTELRQSHETRTELLNELINDSFIKLSQFSQLISGKQAIANSLDQPNSSELKSSLDQDWLSYNINLDLDYLAVFNNRLELLAKEHSPVTHGDPSFEEKLLEALNENKNSPEPQYFIYCNTSCLLVVLEPFINKNGKEGTIILAQNMSDIVRIFYQFSKTGLGILISTTEPDTQTIQHRYLEQWQTFAWAISDFNKIFPVLKDYTKEHEIKETHSYQLHKDSIAKRSYLIKGISIANYTTLGNKAYFISVDDKTIEDHLVKSSIQRSIITGLIGLVISEFIMLLLIHSAMKRLINISDALHLLPKQRFTAAINLVDVRTTVFKDELSTLEKSVVFVSLELKKLYEEVKIKNKSLEDQIQALTRSRSFLTRLFDNSQIFIITQDFYFTILSTNKRFDSIYPEKPNKFSTLIFNDAELTEFKDKIEGIKQHEIEVFQQEGMLYSKPSKPLMITWTHTLVEDEQGNEIILSIGMDQTKQKNAEKDLRWMANHDSLTGVGNRRYFNSVFREMLNTENKGAIIFIDVNRFKQINDIYGHNAGDRVLIEISDLLKKLIRDSDIISRFAGDEFTALLPNMTINALPPVLDKLCRNLRSQVQLENNRVVQYSVSIGAALFPEHGCDPQTLIINADMAMYHSKKKGDGHWHIFDANDEMVVQMKNDNSLLLQLKNAIKQKSFQLVYQPILDIKNERISHYEALIRMNDEEGKPVSPGLFIPLAERSGEIRNIDEWVLEHVIEIIQSHSKKNQRIDIAVNISAPTLQSHDFPEMVQDKISQYKIDPNQLIIELTETAYIENFQQVLKNLQLITHFGVKVALDDFGVGFSSFNYLKMLPLTYVKLDGSYIKHLTKNPDDQIFVRSLSAMVSAFGMEVIAEFVEDLETLEMIESLGVTHGQGYYIGKPGPLELPVNSNSQAS